MNPATQASLTPLRQLLADRRSELLSELLAAQEARRMPVATHEVFDQKEQAAETVEARLGDAQDERDRAELAQVEAALQRLDAGHYGDCEDCGEPIALQRLRVQPAALRCAACESRHEAAPRRGLAAP